MDENILKYERSGNDEYGSSTVTEEAVVENVTFNDRVEQPVVVDDMTEQQNNNGDEEAIGFLVDDEQYDADKKPELPTAPEKAASVESYGRVVGVSFRKCGKVYRFDAGELEVYPGDWVIVETARGMEMGQIMFDNMEIAEDEQEVPIKPIIRKANSEDYKTQEENRYLSAEAFRVGLEKISEHNLPMKLIEVDYTLDQSKIVFHFTAVGRVDFRSLVRDLASVFHKRIELHQIGVRDAAKLLGGLGPCGKTCCCSTHMKNFEPVSIKMAKEQGLSLNPVKISGTCGRLMCCLNYEFAMYEEILTHLPPLESQVNLPGGTGVVVGLNVPQQTVIIELPSKSRVEYSSESLKQTGENLYELKKGQNPFQKKKKKESFQL
jgi:cell fate regulator YaaT (PSP1 superfamily)